MTRYYAFDTSRIRLRPLSERGHDLSAAACVPLGPPATVFEHPEFPKLVELIREAHGNGRPVVLMMGGHPVKLGLNRFIIDLIERGWVTHLAMNGAGLIHDFELALVGGTSENVAKWIQVGQFGLWQETGLLNDIALEAAERGEGFGEAAGRTIESGQNSKARPNGRVCPNFAYPDLSIAAAGWRCKVPVTVHVSIGSDIVHAHANCSGAAIGQASYTDFLIFVESISRLQGGVFLNVGSAVTGPEVYLKALSMARNVAYQDGCEIRAFSTAVFDLIPLPSDFRSGTPTKDQAQYYYRPWKTILVRTVADGGQSFYFCGDHRQTIPTLWRHLVDPDVGVN